jgi:hypothetical protein
MVNVWFTIITNNKYKNEVINTFKTNLACTQRLCIEGNLYSNKNKAYQNKRKQTNTKIMKMDEILSSLVPTIVNQNVHQTLLLHSFRSQNIPKSINPLAGCDISHVCVHGVPQSIKYPLPLSMKHLYNMNYNRDNKTTMNMDKTSK